MTHERLRPGYPAAAVDWLLDGVPSDGVVVDVGAGKLNHAVLRPGKLVLLVALTLTAWMLGSTGPPRAAASCVGPSLAVGEAIDPAGPATPAPMLEPGQAVSVVGIWFHRGCADTYASGPGCSGPRSGSDPETPLIGVRLELHQGNRSWLLGTADATDRAHQYGVRWLGTVPSAARPGAAELRADQAVLEVSIS